MPGFATRRAFLEHYLLGHPEAVAANLLLIETLHVADDLADGDKPVAPADALAALRAALVQLPLIPFYRAHIDRFAVLLDAAILRWECANALEATGSLADRHIAFGLRSDYIAVLEASLVLVGGREYALSVLPDVHRYWKAEGLSGYLTNLDAQFAAAAARSATGAT